jgi:chromosomal replication initiation ATPase DnaA
MSAVLDLNDIPKAIRDAAPRYWRYNGSGGGTRHIDMDWVNACMDALRAASSDDPRSRSRYNERCAKDISERPSVETVFTQVMAMYPHISDTAILSKSRARKLVNVRHEIAYEVRRRAGASYPVIGRLLGHRDHSSIFYAIAEWPAKAAKLGIPCKPLGGE